MALRDKAKRGGEPVITPLRDKKTGKILTNVQIIRNMDKVLTALKDSDKTEDQVAYQKMINSDQSIYDWIHEVASIKDDFEAQNRINNSLIPNPAAAAAFANMGLKAKP